MSESKGVVQLTDEQRAVVASSARIVLVNAYAGTGKTSTLVEYAKARPQERMLYIAFNKSIAEEAKTKFPSNVECRTTHSMAFGAIIPRLFADLSKTEMYAKVGDMRPMTIASLLQVNPRMAAFAKATLDNWFCSADEEIDGRHIDRDMRVPDNQRGLVVGHAKELFKLMCDPTNRMATLPHDGYLKLYQLSKPDLSRKYARLMLDEGQDTNMATLDIVMRQNTGLVFVGDENQAIYQFRGASNAMKLVKPDERHYLTTSFRFGAGVAGIASSILGTFRSLPKPITGLGKHRQTQFKLNPDETYCVITRTNAALFDDAVTNLKSTKPYHFVGGTANYRFEKIMDAYYLYMQQQTNIKDPVIRQFDSLADLRQAADDTEDLELVYLCKIAETYGERIPDLIRQIEERHVPLSSPNELKGGIVYTTAHKSKGLEFDQVLMTNDYGELLDEKGELKDDIKDEEINLLYVAATRAQRAIQLNTSIIELLTYLKEKNAHQANQAYNGNRAKL